jgi:hypothetical protein
MLRANANEAWDSPVRAVLLGRPLPLGKSFRAEPRRAARTGMGTLCISRLLVLNYDAMKRLDVKTYAALLVLIALLSACSGPTENSGSSNANAPQQANSNTSEQPQVAQTTAQPGTPVTVQPMPPPAPKADDDTTKAAEKPPAERNANTAKATNPRAPKLVAPEKKLNFGKQLPQDKTLIRAIAIRNAGKEDLKIESVAPS